MTTAVLEHPDFGFAPPVARTVGAAALLSDPDYEHYPNVPVFVEHQTTARNGRILRFGRRELEQVAGRCNRRIAETGDYAGVVIGHTADEPDGSGPPKPLIGMAGPFRVGRLGTKAAILADFHVRKTYVGSLKDFPRRSPELWLADDYAEMFFDPISLLGAEAPRLDMGLMYSRRKHGDREVEVYTAVCPGPMNAAPRGEVTIGRPKKTYAAGPQSGAPKPTPQKTQTARRAMALEAQDIQQIVDALEQLDWVQYVKQQMMTDAAGAAPHDEPDADNLGSPDDVPTPDEAPPTADFPPGPAPDAPKLPGIGDGDADNAPPVPPAPTGIPKPGDKDAPAVKYAKIFHAVNAMRSELDQAKAALEEERGKRVNVERYAALSERRQLYAFDLDKEAERCKYGKMSDPAFAEHLKMIEDNYRPIPINTHLPTFQVPTPEAPGGKRALEKYSKEHSDRAFAIAQERSLKGERVSYEAILADVAGGKL